jgi:hypothetical protein
MMMDALEVEARFSAEGKISVLSFAWRGQRVLVVGEGRQWRAEDGQHFWVMTLDERQFELAFMPERGLWRLVRAPASERLA